MSGGLNLPEGWWKVSIRFKRRFTAAKFYLEAGDAWTIYRKSKSGTALLQAIASQDDRFPIFGIDCHFIDIDVIEVQMPLHQP